MKWRTPPRVTDLLSYLPPGFNNLSKSGVQGIGFCSAL
jgi:hypothetical protein